MGAEAGSIQGAWLSFTFEHPVDLQLICVVNGQPSSSVAYDNAGKVRSMTVTTQADNGAPRTAPLTVLPTESMQDRQSVNFAEGATRWVRLRVDSYYEGLDVFDPQRGIFEKWTGNVALAEIEFYRQP